MSSAYARFILAFRWPLLLICLGAVATASLGMANLRFESDYRIYFPEDDPRRAAFDAIQQTYTRNDNILFVLHDAENDIVTGRLLEAAAAASEGGWKLSHAIRVDSLSTYQYSRADGDELIVEALAPRPDMLGPEERRRILGIARAERPLTGRLMSEDGHTLAVNVTFQIPDGAVNARAAFVEAAADARALADSLRASFPELRIGLTGEVMQNRAFEEASQADSKLLFPAMYALVALIAFLTLRSASATLATVAVIFAATLAGLGVWGWLGRPLNTASASAPAIILTIAVADSIHVLVVMLREMAAGRAKHAAIAESLRINMGPVFLTSLTTVIGYLALNFSDAPPIADLGNLTAIGVTAAWLLSILLLPALAAVLPIRQPAAAGAVNRESRMANAVIAARLPILAAVGLFAGSMALMVPAIELDDQFVEYFDPSIEFRRDTDFASAHLTGAYALQFSIASGGPGGIADPDYLARLDAFTRWLETQPGVTHVNSFSDVLTRLNRNMHGDDPAFERVPESRELAAQYLLLYEMSLPFGLDLNNQINIDKSATRLVATLGRVTSSDMRIIANAAESWPRANGTGAMAASAVGPALMFAYISETNIRSMMLGNTIAFLLISLTLMIALRSMRLGAVSLLVNILPMIMTLGLWALLVGRIGMASSILTATSLGVVVDFAVHFLSKYNRAKREQGASDADAVRYAYRTVGAPLLVTALILIGGFGLLSFSAFLVNAHLGMLTAMTVAFALLVNLVLLPALLARNENEEGKMAARALRST